MDYLTKFYKNQSEVLSEQIARLEYQLKILSESEAPASTFSGTGAGQQRFSDLELENQMRKHKRSGFLGAEVPDEKQSREYLEAKAELERRRGAAKQAPAPAAPKPPVEQTGPVGSPSAVPTRTEVQRTQAVADRTQKPTALPTNVAPGTMHMTDMDGNPIAVQPSKPKQSKLSPKQFNPVAGAKQVAMEVEVDADGEYMISPSGYAQSPTSWAGRHPSHYKSVSAPTVTASKSAQSPSDNMVSRAFSVPGGDEIARMSQLKPANPMVGNVGSPSDARTVTLPSDFHSSNAMPVDATEDPNRAFFNTTMTDLIGTVAKFSPFGGMRPGTVSGPASSEDYKKAADEAAERRKARGIELPPETKSAPAPTPAPKAAPTPVQQAAASPSAAKYAPTSTSVAAPRNPAIGAAVKPSEVSIDPNRNAVQNKVLPVAKAPLAPPAARVIIPQNTVVPGYQKPNPTQAAPQEEDFSKFWAGKPRYGDLELQNMMRQHKRSGFMGSEIPLEKQPLEYRAAMAELKRRGKLK